MTVILSTLAGAAVGAVVALAIYILGIGVETINCACQIIKCNFDMQDAIPTMWKSGSFVTVLLFCTIAGAVIGMVFGFYLMKAEKAEAERLRKEAIAEEQKNQRIKWAGEVKQRALYVANTCEKNLKDYRELISPTYKANDQIDAIINELANVAELKGKVDVIANDIKTKGGSYK